ncbi:MAG: hypothetical protein IRZ08_22140 [Frankia sp.]|nr:hypothetical protein [Frankia sp.]
MLYLAGQILVFVLVAMVVGAVLAWVFLLGPLYRQRTATAQPAASPTPGTAPISTGAEPTPPAASVPEPATAVDAVGSAVDEPAMPASDPAARADANNSVGDEPAVPASEPTATLAAADPMGDEPVAPEPVPTADAADAVPDEAASVPASVSMVTAADPASDERAAVEQAPDRPVDETGDLSAAAVASAAADDARGTGLDDAGYPAGEAAAAATDEEPARPALWGGLAEPIPSSDNLKEIVGIGPVTEARLHALGITTFRQLAAMGDADVARLAARLEGFGDRIIADDWVGQAQELQARYHGALA